LDQFSATVAHFCDLVSLAWGLRMDSLWLGKKHPGLRVLAAAVCPDLVWKEGSLPADRTAANMWTVLERVRSRDPSLGLLAQAGGQTVVEYLSTKYSLLQCVRGEDVTRPYHVELGLGSEQWGRKLPLDLIWEKESVTRAKDRILERLREAEHDRRTPVPVPDMEEEEESVMIVRSKHSEQTHKCDSSHEKKTEHVKKKPKEVIAVKKEPVQPEVELKSYNAFLPPGVVTLTPGGPVTVLLKVPGLKLRLNDVVGRMVRVEQKEEFTLASITSKTGAVLQPRDSMFPAVEVEISSTGNEDTELDSKIVHYAVASVRV